MSKNVFFIAPFGQVDGRLFHLVFSSLICNKINFDVLTEYLFIDDAVVHEIRCSPICDSESIARCILGDNLVNSILSSVSNNEL